MSKASKIVTLALIGTGVGIVGYNAFSDDEGDGYGYDSSTAPSGYAGSSGYHGSSGHYYRSFGSSSSGSSGSSYHSSSSSSSRGGFGGIGHSSSSSS